MTTKNILLVEPEGIVRTDLELRLGNMGHNITGSFPSCEKAIKGLKEIKKPDLALIDTELGQSTKSIEFGNLMYIKYNIPVIYITGDPEFLKIAENSTYTDVLDKPVENEELSEAINKA